MELYQLKTFAMVAKEEHLTRAAKRLNASQPAVSAHIKALEDELGVDLFSRTPKGMALTPEGLQLQEYALQILETAHKMKIYASSLQKTISGELRLGIHTEPDFLRIPELFSTMRKQHPQLRLQLLQSMTGEAANRLENEEIDAAFIYGRASSKEFFSMDLQQMKLVVAGPAEWEARLDFTDPKKLEHFPWIITPADCPLHGISTALFDKYKIFPDEVVSTDQEAVIKTMVKAGVGLSLLFEHDVQQQSLENEFTIWDHEELTLPLAVVCLAKRKDELLLQTLLSLLQRVWMPAGKEIA